MKTRKRKKKKNQSPENPRVFRRLPSFVEPTRNDGHSTPTLSPASSKNLQREKREKISRERERFRTNVGECSVSLTSPQTTLKPTPNDLLLP